MSTTQISPARRPTSAVLIPVAGAAVAVAAMAWAARPWHGNAPSLDLFALALVAVALLPHVLVALALLRGRAVGWLWWSALLHGVVSSVAGIVLDVEILTEDSSTAALGFLFLPVYQLLGMLPVAAVGALAGWWSQRRHGRGPGA